MDHVAGGKVLPGILIECFVKLADEFFENGAYSGIVNHVGMQVDIFEPLQHLEKQAGLVQLGDGVVKIKLLQHLPHVRRKAADVVAQVGGQAGRVGQQFFKVIEGGVVEGVAGGPAQQLIRVLQLILVLGVGL